MLRVTVMGNLGSDAEVRFSARENRIASFRIAVNQVRTNASGQREESTEWFRVSVMGRQAEYASQLVKGQRVLVDGRLQITRFQRQDGSPGVGFDVWADEVQNAGGRAASDSEDARMTVSATAGDPSDEFPEADLPF
jgi:single-strand DNA-binding protein